MIDSQCPYLRESDPWVVLALNVKGYASYPLFFIILIFSLTSCKGKEQLPVDVGVSVYYPWTATLEVVKDTLGRVTITIQPEFHIMENTVTEPAYRPYAVSGSNISEAAFLKKNNSISN